MTILDVSYITVALVGLWASWFLLWKTYYLDKCRCELFSLRHELFDAALEGEVEFNDPAYHMLRMLLNGMIRYNHRFNLTTIVLGATLDAPEGLENLYTRWLIHVNRLSPESKQHLMSIYVNSTMTLLTYMANCSLLLRLCYLLYRVKSLFTSLGVAGAKAEMAKHIKIDRIERDVYASQEQDYKVGLAAA